MKDKTLSKCTDLSADDNMNLIEFVMSMTYFQFKGELYQQVYGAPMGSLVSVMVADMVMENVEQSAMSSTPPSIKTKIWK